MFKELFADDNERGVSPVIGVILMVAITVILAAVIGAFVLGLGDQVSNTAPQASFSYDFNSSANNVTITHTGGDDIEASQLNVTNGSSTYTWGDGSGTVSAGNSKGFDAFAGDTVRVVWSNPSGGSSSTLAERELS